MSILVNYNSIHLDAALHHYDTLHVDDINHTPSADPGSSSRQVSFRTLGRSFRMSLDRDKHILSKDFAVYSVDSAGKTKQHEIDQRAFLHGHLESERSFMFPLQSQNASSL